MYTAEDLSKVEFDPRKNYQWSVDETFTLNGKEFSALFNSALSLTTLPFSMENLFKLAGMYSLLEAKLKEGILEGKIKEFEPPTKEEPEIVEFEEVK